MSEKRYIKITPFEVQVVDKEEPRLLLFEETDEHYTEIEIRFDDFDSLAIFLRATARLAKKERCTLQDQVSQLDPFANAVQYDDGEDEARARLTVKQTEWVDHVLHA